MIYYTYSNLTTHVRNIAESTRNHLIHHIRNIEASQFAHLAQKIDTINNLDLKEFNNEQLYAMLLTKSCFILDCPMTQQANVHLYTILDKTDYFLQSVFGHLIIVENGYVSSHKLEFLKEMLNYSEKKHLPIMNSFFELNVRLSISKFSPFPSFNQQFSFLVIFT